MVTSCGDQTVKARRRRDKDRTRAQKSIVKIRLSYVKEVVSKKENSEVQEEKMSLSEG